jgi:hypothetical protein
MVAGYNGCIDWQSNQPRPIKETNMITKRSIKIAASLVLFIAAMLAVFSAAIASRGTPVNLQGQATANFDAYDYYMRHPQAQPTNNFDAFDYYMRHPQAQPTSNFDAFDYYMTHPKLNNH